MSVSAMIWLVDFYHLGRLDPAVTGTRLFRNDAEMAQLAAQVSDEIHRLPLWEARDRLDRDVEESLRTITTPEMAVVAYTQMHHQTMRYLFACARGREGWLITRENEQLLLRSVDPNNLGGAVVSALPALAPAQFPPFSLPLGDEPKEEGYLVSVNADSRSKERRLWDQLAEQPKLGAGQIVAQTRDRAGRVKRTDSPLCFVDLDIGSWTHEIEHRGGRQYMFCAPADRGKLAAKIAQLQQRLVDA